MCCKNAYNTAMWYSLNLPSSEKLTFEMSIKRDKVNAGNYTKFLLSFMLSSSLLFLEYCGYELLSNFLYNLIQKAINSVTKFATIMNEKLFDRV